RAGRDALWCAGRRGAGVLLGRSRAAPRPGGDGRRICDDPRDSALHGGAAPHMERGNEMKAKIIDRKWVVEWFDERQCYHMPSLTLADNGNLLAVWNGGFLQWNGDPMGRDAKDWVSVLEPEAKAWSNPDAVGCDIRYCCHDPIYIQNHKGEIILLYAKFLDT